MIELCVNRLGCTEDTYFKRVCKEDTYFKREVEKFVESAEEREKWQQKTEEIFSVIDPHSDPYYMIWFAAIVARITKRLDIYEQYLNFIVDFLSNDLNDCKKLSELLLDVEKMSITDNFREFKRVLKLINSFYGSDMWYRFHIVYEMGKEEFEENLGYFAEISHKIPRKEYGTVCEVKWHMLDLPSLINQVRSLDKQDFTVEYNFEEVVDDWDTHERHDEATLTIKPISK